MITYGKKRNTFYLIEYTGEDSSCTAYRHGSDGTHPIPRAFDTVKYWSIIGLDSVKDFCRFDLTPIDIQSIPNRYPTIIRTKPRGGIVSGTGRGKAKNKGRSKAPLIKILTE